MRLIALWVVVVVACTAPLAAQQQHTISGSVQDEAGQPLPGSTVVLTPGKRGAITGRDGRFILNTIPEGRYLLKVTFLGFEPLLDSLVVDGDLDLHLHLEPEFQSLHEVRIEGNYAVLRQLESPLSLEIAGEQFLRQHLEGSLMKSLDRLPGVDAIGIGAGQSSPVIRGMAFNRIVVVENGIRHEGQQWGSDHGLEVDQFAVGRAEVIKGPASLRYGSDAVGGVIILEQTSPPEPQSVGAEADLTAKSNNRLMGGSFRVYARGQKSWVSLRGTVMDYGDYRVPADSVDIYSYRAPLHEHKIRNSAGQERNLHAEAGWKNNGFTNRLNVSFLESRNGFFANAHGLEPRRVDAAMHDRSDRDILYPRHEVNHWKVINRSTWRTARWRVNADVGFQRNFRQEWSTYVDHGYMPPVFPDTLSFPADLERQFEKHTLSANFVGEYSAADGLKISSGLQAEYQQNRIDGRGFIIPAYEQIRSGAFLVLSRDLSDQSMLSGGLRYDLGRLLTNRYLDWYPSPVNDGETSEEYARRAVELDRVFGNLTWSVGYNLHLDHLDLRANVGKSFRMPIAKELAANGVNYHRFSYEKGDPGLSAETAYQLDAGVEWHKRKYAVGITPFFTWFPNYIYLNPGFEHDRLYGNGNQVFTYTESKVLRYGGELHAHYQPHRTVKLGIIAEYLYSIQVSGEKEGFGLPFSPAPSMLLHAKFSPEKVGPLIHPYILVDVRLAAAQQRIVPPEEPTPGYQLIHTGFGAEIPLGNRYVDISFQVKNLLNRKYFDHTSYYRLINLPEAGRNMVLNVTIPLSGKIKQDSN